MKKKDKFFLVVLATVLLFRLGLFFAPADSFFFEDYYHHVYIGVLLVFAFAFLNYELHQRFFYLFAVAIGLIVDEIVYLIPIPIEQHIGKAPYFSWESFVLMFVGLLAVYLMRGLLIKEVKDTLRK
ncbi:hypothetical protein ISS04_04590 [Candidatus Woesearchaeota archaeon]|nr:hypothetical protein [Candidatus Woesearchaeota archaeon]